MRDSTASESAALFAQQLQNERQDDVYSRRSSCASRNSF